MKSLDWPYPSVLAGTLRTMLGKMKGGSFDQKTVEALKRISISGPLPMWNGSLFLHAPKDILVKEEGNKRHSYAIRPGKMNNGEGCDLPHPSLLPAMLPDSVEEFKPAKIAPLWSLEKMTEWLTSPDGNSFGTPPAPNEVEGGETGFLNLPEKDPRMHVKIEPGLGTSEEGMLFETIGLDFSVKGRKEEFQIAAKVEADDAFSVLLSQIDSFNSIGGERRLAHWKAYESQIGWDCPEKITKELSGKTRVRMILATPAIFAGGWLPGWLHSKGNSIEGTPPGAPEGLNLKLVSACIERWKPISGWSLEKDKEGFRKPEPKAIRKPGPKAIRRLVPAGAVYFFEVAGNAEMLAKKLWLKPVSDDEQDRNDGFGLAMWGIWDNTDDGKLKEQKKGTGT
jgi:CRISPR-associated protein Cmr3